MHNYNYNYNDVERRASLMHDVLKHKYLPSSKFYCSYICMDGYVKVALCFTGTLYVYFVDQYTIATFF